MEHRARIYGDENRIIISPTAKFKGEYLLYPEPYIDEAGRMYGIAYR